MSGRSRLPFTASQWQELEHQALIFKYMVSGIPIPPDLLFAIRRSCLDSPLSSKLFPRQPPHIGWSCFQMGLGRKIDPEPGRCRRTDGKKWRCSKEAYPDSKYCERHMHRGKNRSRKPVETMTNNLSTTIPTISSITKTPSSALLSPSPHSLSLLSPETHRGQSNLHFAGYHQAHPSQQFLSSSTPRNRGIGLSPQDSSTTHSLLDSGGSLSLVNTDYRRDRSGYGHKEEVDERAFFTSEPSGSSMRSLSGSSLDDPWQLTPLTMSSCSSACSSSKQRGLSSLHNEYSYLQLQSLSDQDNSKHQNQQQQYQPSYVLGSDISCPPPIKPERNEHEPEKTVHRFFDEWPPKNKDSWLDSDDKSSNSASTTRLSISIPSSHDFPIFNSRSHSGN
ncbi:hypothetical protein Tsubulata_028005 [Turnera subulata]|uniref:Growth-regulating factor n=1 Tax=Turnera subulata TaxID=218843 RepID=A0A9Q0JJW6_9ROSI|nr:hypothetical protein Tsubulata_028005 [Turnera subulata]